MEGYLKRDIKELIDSFPPLAEILEEYGIGCVPCSVGTCQLLDVVEIHNLPSDLEREMMTRMAGVIYPDRNVAVPERRREKETGPGQFNYSPPMKQLVDEHVFIYRWAELIPEITEKLNIREKHDRQLILEGVDFIRSYADSFHHAKEEDILFSYFDENLEIIQVMHEDHNNARGHVRALVQALEKGDSDGVAHNLRAYGEILTQHIKKEDEILYPWMDRNLTTTQVGELFSRFDEVNTRFGDAPKTHEGFIKKIETRLRSKEVSS